MNQQTEILELEITQEDIDKAVKTKCSGVHTSITKICAFSQAAIRIGVKRFYESASKGLHTKNGLLWTGDENLKDFVNNFDLNYKRENYSDYIKPQKFILVKV